MTKYPPPDSCDCRRHSHSCGWMSNRPASLIGRPLGAARWASLLTPLGQAQDALGPLGPARPVGLPMALRPSVPPGQPTLAYDAGSASLCRGMSDRPPRPPSGRSWGQARWTFPPTPPSQATQAHDALNQELPAGMLTLAIDVNNSHSCCGMINRPLCTPADDPGVRPAGPILQPFRNRPRIPSAQRGPPGCSGTQAFSTLGQAARQSSQFPTSVPRLAHRPSVPRH